MRDALAQLLRIQGDFASAVKHQAALVARLVARLYETDLRGGLSGDIDDASRALRAAEELHNEAATQLHAAARKLELISHDHARFPKKEC